MESASCRGRPGHDRMDEGARRRISPGAILPAMKPASALRLIHWAVLGAVLAFVLVALGPAWAQDARPLDLDQTRAALASTEAALRDKNASRRRSAGPARPERYARAWRSRGRSPISRPALAASAKRLAELTPKSGEAAPATDVAAKELESEKKRRDTLDANLRAARAMLLQADDLSTRISAARRQLFARQTFARSSSVLDPQLWVAVWREVPIDAGVMRSLIGNWLGAVGERLTPALQIGIAAVALALALAVALLAWLTRRVIHRDASASAAEPAPPRARRRVDLLRPGGAAARSRSACWRARSTPSTFPIRASRALIDAALDAARTVIVVNALARGHARPRSRGLAARADERPRGVDHLSRRDGDRGDLGRRAADRARRRRRRLAQHRGRGSGRGRDPRFAGDRLRAAPARRAGRRAPPDRAASRPLDAAEDARLGARVRHFRRRRSPATSPSPRSSSIRRSTSPPSAACSISSTASFRTGPKRCSSRRRRSGRG